MQITLKERIKEELIKLLDIKDITFDVDRPPSGIVADLATNITFVLARVYKSSPFSVAENIKEKLKAASLFKNVVIKRGFINIDLKDEVLFDVLEDIEKLREDYGRIDEGRGRRVLIEFISANPTGLLHIGHGRGGIYGDVLANIFTLLGYRVEREYYVNDRGRQVELLGLSLQAEYLNLIGKETPPPEGGYKGSYIKEKAEELKKIYSSSLETYPTSFFTQYAIKSILSSTKTTLSNLGIHFDNFVFESSFYEKNKNFLKNLLDKFKILGYTYNKDEALYFRSSLFGDTKDRVIIKKNQEYTYFISDILYHIYKYERGYDLLINIWGADHHGYIPRLLASIKALNYDTNKLKILLYQVVHLLKDRKLISMSTREGVYVTLDELMKEVGKDATRFFLLLTRPDTPLEFDIDKALQHSLDNPLYYIQYAHCRCASILRKVGDVRYQRDSLYNLKLQEERSLMTKLALFPDLIKETAVTLQPYRIISYLLDIAKSFHHYYMQHRVISQDKELMQARLYLIRCIRQIINNGLNILGVSAPDRM